MKPSKKVKIIYPAYTEEELVSSQVIPEKIELIYKAYAEQVKNTHPRQSIAPDIPFGLVLNLPFTSRLGFRRKEVSLVASRPGVGKTAFLINAIDSLITSGKFNSAVFLPDMPPAEFCARLTAVRAGVDYNSFRRGGLRSDMQDAVSKAGKEISSANLWISTEKTFSVESLVKSALELSCKLRKEKKKLDVIFIDSFNYLSECGDLYGHKGWSLEQLTDLAAKTETAVICSYGLEAQRSDGSSKKHLAIRDFRVRGISEDAVGLIINIARPNYYDLSGLYKDEVNLDIVWDKFGCYGHSLIAKFDHNSLRFYT